MKAIITAGGKGSRLYPISRAIPKELIPFCGVPTIEYGINFLKENGIKDIIIVVGTKKSPIIDYLGNGELFGVNIAYIIQENPKGLGHAVQVIERYIEDENFILALGDNIYIGDTNIKQMIKNHIQYDASSTIFIEHLYQPEKYGVVKFDRFDNSNNEINNIIDLYEKPREEKIKNDFKINSGWYAIAGIYIFNKNIFDYLRETPKGFNNEVQLTDAIKLSLDKGNKILGHIFNGRRIDVGTWDYLIEEKRFYNSLDDNKLRDIVDSRNIMMNKINGYQ